RGPVPERGRYPFSRARNYDGRLPFPCNDLVKSNVYSFLFAKSCALATIGKMSEQPPIILVIDDDESVLDYTLHALGALGYNATGAVDTEAAMELVKTLPSLQLLLSDICLKAETGPELIRQALRNRPDLKVVFMTGGFLDVTFRRTDPLLRKPFRITEL